MDNCKTAAPQLDTLDDKLLEETLAICRIPAPTFAERERARYIQERLNRMGLEQVERDDLHNVTAILPGKGGGATLAVVAHMDTVFPKETDVEPKWDGRYWRAPGIRDNSASVAITLLLPEILRRNDLQLDADLMLAFSVGEEGLGDLRGIKALMKRHGSSLSAVLAADGNLGDISNIGVAARRLKVSATVPGGHSWADAGAPSAIHLLAGIAADISHIPLPTKPKTVLNVGTFAGGTSVNAIAQEAQFLLDMRSTDPVVLAKLEKQVRKRIETAGSADKVDVTIEVVGDRPGGGIPEDHGLVQAILKGYRSIGVSGVLQSSSTDANIPLSLGIPASSLGVCAGAGIHTLEEYLEPDSLALGARALVLTLLALQENPL